MNRTAEIKAIEKEIVRVTIRHYFNSKDECAPGLPSGWECTLCASVKKYEKLLGEEALKEIARAKESTTRH
jgi:hypothetical protein